MEKHVISCLKYYGVDRGAVVLSIVGLSVICELICHVYANSCAAVNFTAGGWRNTGTVAVLLAAGGWRRSFLTISWK
jgi:hypothetical protein